jgi:hypothetical protein
MQPPGILDGISVVEQSRLRACGHGLKGWRVRPDLHGRSDDACTVAKARVLDHARIWKPTKGTVEDQVLIAKAYGDWEDIAINTAIYCAGFNVVWTVIPADSGMF